MDALVHSDWPLPSRRQINEIRLHLGVTLLSELCNAAGTHIDPWIWKGKQRSKVPRPELWPAAKTPSTRAVELWQVMLNSLFSDPASPSHALRSPLGPWLNQMDSKWIWWLDTASNRVLEHRSLQEWHQWSPQPVQYQQQHYRHLSEELDPPFPTMQRISVTVSRVRLVIASVGPAPAYVPPTEPASLYARLESLPKSAHWAVQHAKVDDDGLYIADAIRQGKAVVVSDASLNVRIGTSSTVIEGDEPDHRLLGHTLVPGPVKEGDSLRCESAGNLSGVLLVNTICAHHNITSGSITVACDNMASLQPFKPDYLPDPKHKNFDLMQAVWASVQESPIQWIPVLQVTHRRQSR